MDNRAQDQADHPLIDDELQTSAATSLLEISRDPSIRAGLRIHAARLILFGPSDFDVGEELESGRAHEDEDVYDAIAERVITRIEPLIAQMKGN